MPPFHLYVAFSGVSDEYAECLVPASVYHPPSGQGAEGCPLLSVSSAVSGPVGECVVRSRCSLVIGKPSPHPGKANLLGSGHSQPCPETLAGLALVYFLPHKAEVWSSSLDLGSVGNSWMIFQEVPQCWLHIRVTWGGHSELACPWVDRSPSGSWALF